MATPENFIMKIVVERCDGGVKDCIKEKDNQGNNGKETD